MDITENLINGTQEGFVAFLRKVSLSEQIRGNVGLWANYQSAHNSFASFLSHCGLDDVAIGDMNSRLVEDYEVWLVGRGVCRNTSSFYMRALQAVYNRAVERGMAADRKPFRCVYRGVANTMRRAVDANIIRGMQQLDLRAELLQHGHSEGKRLQNLLQQLELARDCFLFSFCARGLTFVDMAFLLKANVSGSVLAYTRRKTHQRIQVRMEPMMSDIVRRHPTDTPYLLPILSVRHNEEPTWQQYRYRRQQYNKLLRLLGEMLGGVPLTSYVSRHSWASAANERGVPLAVISQGMGHGSLKTTEVYLRSLSQGCIDGHNHALLQEVFSAPTNACM